MKSKIVMLGAFPPPVFGLSKINVAVHEELANENIILNIINTSASQLNRSYLSRFMRLPRMLKAMFSLGFTRRFAHASLYMSLSGGWGQVYECVFLLIARLKRMHIFIHHHSFAYLTQPGRLTWITTLLAGKQSRHIALCQEMAIQLQALYPAVQHVTIVSNSVFIPTRATSAITPAPPIAPHKQLKRVGFISNISREKGIIEFLDIIADCEKEDLPIIALIAGPCENSTIEQLLEKRIHSLSNVRYIGAQYGRDKDLFFEQIDVLIFPTKYKNEAEPLILYEAMQNGIPVITKDRGCIAERITADIGLVIPPGSDFVTLAMKKLREWLDSPDSFQHASVKASQQFEAIRQENTSQWEALKQIIIQPDLKQRDSH